MTVVEPWLYELRVHVPISQVWPRSVGGQSGKTHLHVRERTVIGRIKRDKGRSLCGRSGWFEREPDSDRERSDICPRCAEIAARLP